MAHSLILGMTESGKSTLGKGLSRIVMAKGFHSIVLDPMNDPSWPASFRTSRVDEFLRVFWASRQCFAFIDEAGESVGRFDDLMIKTATKGRHWGHSCFYLSQRGAQLSRTVRDQCSHLFLFTTALDDCKIHSNEWNKAELREAHTLPQGHYFHATRFGLLERGNVFEDFAEPGPAISGPKIENPRSISFNPPVAG